MVDLHSFAIQTQGDELTKPTGVVIFHGLGIAEHLEDGVAVQHLPFEGYLALGVSSQLTYSTTAVGNSSQSLLIGFCLTRT